MCATGSILFDLGTVRIPDRRCIWGGGGGGSTTELQNPFDVPIMAIETSISNGVHGPKHTHQISCDSCLPCHHFELSKTSKKRKVDTPKDETSEKQNKSVEFGRVSEVDLAQDRTVGLLSDQCLCQANVSQTLYH